MTPAVGHSTSRWTSTSGSTCIFTSPTARTFTMSTSGLRRYATSSGNGPGQGGLGFSPSAGRKPTRRTPSGLPNSSAIKARTSRDSPPACSNELTLHGNTIVVAIPLLARTSVRQSYALLRSSVWLIRDCLCCSFVVSTSRSCCFKSVVVRTSAESRNPTISRVVRHQSLFFRPRPWAV